MKKLQKSAKTQVIRHLVWLALLFMACSSSVDLRYFSLQEFFREPSDSPTMPLPIAIGVENFRSAPSLRRQEIILRDGKEQRLSLYSHQLWWALPEEMVTEAFKNYLAGQKVFQHVLAYPNAHGVRYYVEGVLKTFEIQADAQEWKSCVALEVYLVEQEKNAILWNSGLLEVAVSASPTMEDAVRKMGDGLREIFAKAATELRKRIPGENQR